MTAHTGVQIVDDALADMRSGRSVLVVASDAPTAKKLFDAARSQLELGETARRPSITHSNGGWISFEHHGTVQAAVRGLQLDRVYFDHSAAMEAVVGAMIGSDSPLIRHYPPL